jgi:hypothetical protein
MKKALSSLNLGMNWSAANMNLETASFISFYSQPLAHIRARTPAGTYHIHLSCVEVLKLGFHAGELPIFFLRAAEQPFQIDICVAQRALRMLNCRFWTLQITGSSRAEGGLVGFRRFLHVIFFEGQWVRRSSEHVVDGMTTDVPDAKC